MATEVIMPKAGMAMEEGTIVKWFKKEGDRIEKGEAILEILTDKVNMEVEAETSGTLIKIKANEGDVLPVFSTIGYIGEEGEELPEHLIESNKDSKKSPLERSKKEVKEIVIKEKEVDELLFEKVRATPAARRVARERNIDLLEIRGTGPKGRIQLCDVRSINKTDMTNKRVTPLAMNIAKAERIDIETIDGSGFKGKVLKADVEKFIDKKEQTDNRGKIIPVTGMRKVIAERMSNSYFTIPTVTLNIDVDMSKTKALREEVKELILLETGNKITYTDIILMAVSKALSNFPMINSSFVEEGILMHDRINIAMAVGLDDGLLVPVIEDVDKKSLREIVCATKDIIERTKSNKLTPDEMEGSTFTISNLGMYGITHFNPIINQPNSAILGVNTITDKMVIIEGEPQIRPMMTLSLTIDHRVIDGAPGAKFLQYLKQLLENPMKLLV